MVGRTPCKLSLVFYDPCLLRSDAEEQERNALESMGKKKKTPRLPIKRFGEWDSYTAVDRSLCLRDKGV
ncbi:hypothetical protein JTE90_021071 [Oedothorax gibbosus]|uniref:Uncharacterized protein n=1 Tax=Oedothorax gibbosus TaxID=931172 RepID=A0AAV6VTM6_9ARAC|nr:hypothetical protein JTE90_021071 [Oedothorax gibbosus]